MLLQVIFASQIAGVDPGIWDSLLGFSPTLGTGGLLTAMFVQILRGKLITEKVHQEAIRRERETIADLRADKITIQAAYDTEREARLLIEKELIAYVSSHGAVTSHVLNSLPSAQNQTQYIPMPPTQPNQGAPNAV